MRVNETIERYVIGPALTAAVLFLHQQLIQAGWLPTTAAGLSLLVLVAGFVGGIRSGLASAGLLAIYNLTFLGPVSAERLVVIGSYFIMAGLIGWQTRQERLRRAEAIEAWKENDLNRRKAVLVDSINGNLHLAHDAINMLDVLWDSWRGLSEERRLELVERIRGKLADWATLVGSFRAIAEQKERLLDGDEGVPI